MTYKPPALARGAARMTIRKMVSDIEADFQAFARGPVKELHTGSRAARERVIRAVSHGRALSVVASKDRRRASMLQFDTTTNHTTGARSVGLLHTRIWLEDELEFRDISVVFDPHVMKRLAERTGRLDLEDALVDIVAETAGWLLAAAYLGAKHLAVPFADGVLVGGQRGSTAILKTFISFRNKGDAAQARLARLKDELGPRRPSRKPKCQRRDGLPLPLSPR